MVGHSKGANCVAFSPDGLCIASGSNDSDIIMWDARTYNRVRSLIGHRGAVFSVVFSADGEFIASGASDNSVIVWSKGGSCLHKLTGHTSWVRSVALSPDMRYIASGSDDSTVIVWEMGSGKRVRSLGHDGLDGCICGFDALDDDFVPRQGCTANGHSEPVRSVAFSAHGLLASGSRDGTIKIWSTNDFSHLHTLNCLPLLVHPYSNAVHSVAFSEDGRFLASASCNRTVSIWDANTGTHLRSLTGRAWVPLFLWMCNLHRA